MSQANSWILKICPDEQATFSSPLFYHVPPFSFLLSLCCRLILSRCMCTKNASRGYKGWFCNATDDAGTHINDTNMCLQTCARTKSYKSISEVNNVLFGSHCTSIWDWDWNYSAFLLGLVRGYRLQLQWSEKRFILAWTNLLQGIQVLK